MQRSLFDYASGQKGGRPPSPEVINVDEDSDKDSPMISSLARKRTPSRSKSPKRAVLRAEPPSVGAASSPQITAITTTTAVSLSASSCVWLHSLITDPAWASFLAPLTSDSWRKGTFHAIERFLDAQAAAEKVVLPPRPDIFAAFNGTPLDHLRVVLLGQDPYHGCGQAHGLCFSVRPGVRVPPSLQNMYRELVTDIPGFQPPSHGYLQSWASQGVLMLNATLTVEAHRANSHKDCGWQLFTDDVIRALSTRHPNRLVFLLWGNFARKKKALINLSRHVVIENAHPSPLSARAWFGCRCFSKCNEELRRLGEKPIDWSLPAAV